MQGSHAQLGFGRGQRHVINPDDFDRDPVPDCPTCHQTCRPGSCNLLDTVRSDDPSMRFPTL